MKKTIIVFVLTTTLVISTACSAQNKSGDSVVNNADVSSTIVETTTTEETTVESTEATVVEKGEETKDPSLKLIEPSEDYVIACLQTVEDITEIEAATEDHDPNNGLHKQGRYTAAVYFRTSKLTLIQEDDGDCYLENDNGNKEVIYVAEDEDVNSPVDLGTNGGGQIEVYRTVEEAQARDEYLAGFDNSPISAGSHIVVGTMVIRTSDYLTATQQQELTDAIVEALENG